MQENTEIERPTADALAGLLADLTADNINYDFDNSSQDTSTHAMKEIGSQVNAFTSSLSHRELYLTPQGFIKLRHLIKIPVFSKRENQPVSFLVYEIDLTSQENPFELFKLYQKHYLAQQAIQMFLGYFEVDRDFRTMPSNDEMLVLIAMTQDPHYKQVAKLLKLNYRTVDRYAYGLSSKLQDNITLSTVLRKIRSQWILIPTN